MRSPLIACLPLLLLSLSLKVAPVFAQEADNDAIAAAKKAALVVEVTGTAPVTPTVFRLQVQIVTDGSTGGDRTAIQAAHDKTMGRVRAALEAAGFRPEPPQYPLTPGPKVTIRTRENSYRNLTEQEAVGPNDRLQVVEYFQFQAPSRAKAKAALTLLRGTGAGGDVGVYQGVQDEEAARRAALKTATLQAKKRVQILSEAASPKTFDLVYLKEGEFNTPSSYSNFKMQGKEPLTLPPTIDAETKLTLFYGFKPAAAATTAPKAAVKPSKKS